MNKIKESISITIPAHNEEETLRQVVLEALKEVKKYTNKYEVLIVDDGSTDSTPQIADELSKKYPHVRVVHNKRKSGFAGSIKSCYKNAKCELVFLAPADGQISFKDLGKFVDKIGDADIVVGYRSTRPESLSRKIVSKTFHFILRKYFNINLKEISTSKLYRKKVLDAIKMESKSAFLEAEIMIKAIKKGFRTKEVGIPHYPRKHGESKGWRISVILLTIKDLLRLAPRIKNG